MHIYLMNNPAKFHPNPIWKRSPQQQEEEEQQQDE